MTDSDRKLVKRFTDYGDEEAFRALFRRHTPRLYAVVLRMVGGVPADADDVVQETWMRVARLARRFEWRSSLTTWLIGIAINCAREANRMRPVVNDRSAAHLDRVLPTSDPAAIDLERAIAALPDRQRMVLVLHDVEGWTHQEIANRLEIPAGTSKSDLFQARRFLRARLGRTARKESAK